MVAPLGSDDAVSNVLLARRLRDVNGLEADGLMLEYGGIKDGSPLWTLTNPKHGPRIQSLPSELGHSEKGGKTPSAPSAPSAANQFNDLRLTVDERSPSASPSATSATDKADNAADSANACAASHNPLKNTAADSADGKDGNSHTLTGSHVCAQCRSPPNGKERQYAYGDEAIWLHPWCERDFIKAKMEEQGVRW